MREFDNLIATTVSALMKVTRSIADDMERSGESIENKCKSLKEICNETIGILDLYVKESDVKKKQPNNPREEIVSNVVMEPKTTKAKLYPEVKANVIVCLICGQAHTMLKPHLTRKHQMTWLEYQTKFDLPSNYPSVAISYSKKRSQLAKMQNLGTSNRTQSKKSSD